MPSGGRASTSWWRRRPAPWAKRSSASPWERATMVAGPDPGEAWGLAEDVPEGLAGFGVADGGSHQDGHGPQDLGWVCPVDEVASGKVLALEDPGEEDLGDRVGSEG